MEYTLIRSKRKTICIQISESGELIVKAPNRVPKKDIDSFVISKKSWIEKHTTRMKELTANVEKLSSDEIKELANRAYKLIPDKCNYYASILGVSYGRITIRNQRTRWGSCSSKGNLNFNCLLMLCPDKVIDYVVVHELCHRIEMNHSKRFWLLIESIMPDYKEHKKWLKENGTTLFAKLP